MKIIIKEILSLSQHGASCHLLIFNGIIKILLDCGINKNFDFSAYQKHRNEIIGVHLVLISHSSLEYSGAFVFLIDELGLNPKIFYTTQPIMRYAPLNFHEQMVNYRFAGYNKKVFNQIYSIYQEIQLVKPYQKKVIEVEAKQSSQTHILYTSNLQAIHFSCSLGGGSLGSVSWRINIGLLNVLYLVEYNNYTLYHVNGLDLDYLRQKPVHLLLTDCYPQINQIYMKKDYLYEELLKVVTEYNKISIAQVNRMGLLNPQQKKLLITCYPNQLLIEVMQVMKKVVSEVYEGPSRDKIKVIHLSSRYIQLVKSQIQYFSQDFKNSIDKIDQFFVYSRKLLPKINIATLGSINGISNQDIGFNPNQFIVYHVGTQVNQQYMNRVNSGDQYLRKFKIFENKQVQNSPIPIQQEQIKQYSNQTFSNPKKAFSVSTQDMIDEAQLVQQCSEQNQMFINSPNLIPQTPKQATSLHNKFISQIGFPHFSKTKRQSDHQFDDYGLKYRLQQRTVNRMRNVQEQVQDYEKQVSLVKKKSTIQIMNIEFKIPQRFIPFNISNFSFFKRNLCRTNFASSLQIIKILKPKNIIFLNNFKDNSFQLYKNELMLNNSKDYKELLDISTKKICYLEEKNQLIQYKINYIPQQQNIQLQKVRGIIEQKNGALHIHLQALAEKQILDFRMELFYKKVKSKLNCSFNGKGIQIEGIMLYKTGNQIILQGQYSQQFFKVRKLLYQFLKIR